MLELFPTNTLSLYLFIYLSSPKEWRLVGTKNLSEMDYRVFFFFCHDYYDWNTIATFPMFVPVYFSLEAFLKYIYIILQKLWMLFCHKVQLAKDGFDFHCCPIRRLPRFSISFWQLALGPGIAGDVYSLTNCTASDMALV